MRHQDLQLNHRLESYVYANDIARTGASGFVPGDVGRIAYQTDSGQYWRLTATTPAWASIPAHAVVYETAAPGGLTPSGTTSTTGVMVGLGAAGAVITPVNSGNVFVTICGSMFNNTANGGYGVLMHYGTGTAPINGAAIVGTPLGPNSHRVGTFDAGQTVPFSVSGIMAGLTLGTTYWVDLQQAVTVAGTGGMTYVSVSLFELP